MRTCFTAVRAVIPVMCLVLAFSGCSSTRSARWEGGVISSLRSPDALTRRRQLRELSPPATPAVVQAVQATLAADIDPFCRAMAADALARLQAADSAYEVGRALLRDVHYVTRMRALHALADLDTALASEALPGVIKRDPHRFVRAEAVASAGDVLGAERAPGVLVGALEDPSEDVVVPACVELVRLTGIDIPPDDVALWRKVLAIDVEPEP